MANTSAEEVSTQAVSAALTWGWIGGAISCAQPAVPPAVTIRQRSPAHSPILLIREVMMFSYDRTCNQSALDVGGVAGFTQRAARRMNLDQPTPGLLRRHPSFIGRVRRGTPGCRVAHYPLRVTRHLSRVSERLV